MGGPAVCAPHPKTHRAVGVCGGGVPPHGDEAINRRPPPHSHPPQVPSVSDWGAPMQTARGGGGTVSVALGLCCPYILLLYFLGGRGHSQGRAECNYAGKWRGGEGDLQTPPHVTPQPRRFCGGGQSQTEGRMMGGGA